MQNDIHSTQTPDKTPWRDSEWFQNCLALMPLVRWGIVAAMFLFGVYLYQRDTNAASTVNIADLKSGQESMKAEMARRVADRDKQIEELRRAMLTREVFEAYHQADKLRMERIEQLLNRLLER